MIIGLFFTADGADGTEYSQLFDVANESVATRLGLYSEIVSASVTLCCDHAFNFAAIDAMLDAAAKIQDVHTFASVSERLEKSFAFCSGKVTVAIEVKQGKAVKTLKLVVFPQGLLPVVNSIRTALTGDLGKTLVTGDFTAVGEGILAQLTQNEKIPVPAVTASKNSTVAKFKEYVAKHSKAVMQADVINIDGTDPDDLGDDFDGEGLDDDILADDAPTEIKNSKKKK